MKILKLGLLALVLAGCTTVEQSTRLSTNLEAREYNSVYSKYMDRPTFTSIEKMSDGNTVLAISRDNYGTTSSPLRFSKEHVSKYTALIDKYIEWNQLAISRGDAITKEIGKAETWGNSMSGTLKFTFHSGNSAVHYLSISFCAAGTCLDDQALYFDLKNSQELKNLLVQLGSGAVKTEDVNAIYK
ncbi:hypothetical protein [Vibrio cincinnatiensis]|uniref:hypothetical protein n=1 Tax=Vibrio cincinnatiensis TaxID=675 RepID=UPI001EE153BB|nr:hypothetical protein [Vibrio cincinnatiensis]MCG3760637.1 hypothetical protein [Vibrio cincinnatiensis]